RVKLSMPLTEMLADISDSQPTASPSLPERRRSSARSRTSNQDLAAELSARGVESGVARDIAARAAGRFEREVMEAVRYFDSERARGKRFDNPAGLLVSLIRKSLPPEEAPPARARTSMSRRTVSGSDRRAELLEHRAEPMP